MIGVQNGFTVFAFQSDIIKASLYDKNKTQTNTMDSWCRTAFVYGGASHDCFPGRWEKFVSSALMKEPLFFSSPNQSGSL